MEGNRIGLFGQFKNAFKGVVKPRYFNRMANPSAIGLGVYVFVMALISAVVFWGIMYLRCLGPEGFIAQTKRAISNMPQFSYSDGEINFEKKDFILGPFNIYFVFNSEIDKSDAASVSKDEIYTDWGVGYSLVVFNKKEMYVRPVLRGLKFSFSNKQVAETLGLPSMFNREGFNGSMERNFMVYYLVVAGVSMIVFILKAVASGFIFGLAGWGINKIVKQPYTYKELVRISLYITGITTILKMAIMASPLPIPFWLLSIIFLLVGTAYLFFAMVGSTEEAGPTSTIVFNKPGAKQTLEEIAPPDPFERKANGEAPMFTRSTGSSKPSNSSVVPVAPTPKVSESHTVFTAKSTSGEEQSSAATAASMYSTATTSSYTGSSTTSSTTFTTASSSSNTTSSYTTAAPSYSTESTSYSTADTSSYASAETYDTSASSAYTESATAASAFSEAVYNSKPGSIFDEVEGKIPSPVAAGAPAPAPAPAPEPEPEPEPAPAIIKSDLTTFGGVGQTLSGAKKSKPKYARPITAPDAYNGLYYSGSDSEESYESNYGSGTLLDRGGLYGKTIGGTEESNPFSSVLANKPQTSTASASPAGGTVFTVSQGTEKPSRQSYSSPAPSGESHLTFTTKEGSTPFGAGNGGFYLSNPPRSGASNEPITVKKNGKTVNRYSADDFAAWERETYAEEFNKPRGGFGNNIF
ncbi:MAG: DUF1189 domain-containing protein [Lachnospiraceae bacterium]|nr:DUF1189 domain-containing protein [Lachnospiraceae bacterium]